MLVFLADQQEAEGQGTDGTSTLPHSRTLAPRTGVNPLVIVGAGGLGRETAFLVEQINDAAPADAAPWDLRGFVDDAPALQERQVQDQPVRGDVDWLCRRRALHYVLAIGDPAVRRRLAARLDDAPPRAASLIHPSVRLHDTTHVGAGSILCKGVTPTVNVSIGRHAVLDSHVTVGHDATVEAFATLHPGVHLSGNGRLGKGARLGAGAVVLPGVQVGAQTTVGAGAVAHRDLPENCTAVGVPARCLDR